MPRPRTASGGIEWRSHYVFTGLNKCMRCGLLRSMFPWRGASVNQSMKCLALQKSLHGSSSCLRLMGLNGFRPLDSMRPSPNSFNYRLYLCTRRDNICPKFALQGGHNFVMESFDRPTICDVCRKLLRYTCRSLLLLLENDAIRMLDGFCNDHVQYIGNIDA